MISFMSRLKLGIVCFVIGSAPCYAEKQVFNLECQISVESWITKYEHPSGSIIEKATADGQKFTAYVTITDYTKYESQNTFEIESALVSKFIVAERKSLGIHGYVDTYEQELVAGAFPDDYTRVRVGDFNLDVAISRINGDVKEFSYSKITSLERVNDAKNKYLVSDVSYRLNDASSCQKMQRAFWIGWLRMRRLLASHQLVQFDTRLTHSRPDAEQKPMWRWEYAKNDIF